MQRSLLIAASLFAAVSSAPAQDWAKARIAKSSRHLEWITVKHDGREVKCYIGYPEVKNKAPAVVLIHEIFGHTDWVQSMVDQFAEAGYIAIAPDLLSGMAPGGGGSLELGSNVGRVINTIPKTQLVADLDAAADYVGKDPACNGKVVVGGFCWGGGATFLYATHNPTLKAAFVFYGGEPRPEDLALIKSDLAGIKAPIYGFYGGNDARITATVPKATDDMKAAGKQYEPVIYEGAAHGFMRAGEDPGDKNPANKKARDEAWVRLKEILGKL
jgi:carboxymethylenebutenolidase